MIMFILPSIQLSFYLIDVVRVCIHITHYPHLAYRVFSPVLLQITQMPIAHHLPAALHTDESARLPNSIHSSIFIDCFVFDVAVVVFLFVSVSLSSFCIFDCHLTTLFYYSFIYLLIRSRKKNDFDIAGKKMNDGRGYFRYHILKLIFFYSQIWREITTNYFTIPEYDVFLIYSMCDKLKNSVESKRYLEAKEMAKAQAPPRPNEYITLLNSIELNEIVNFAAHSCDIFFHTHTLSFSYIFFLFQLNQIRINAKVQS